MSGRTMVKNTCLNPLKGERRHCVTIPSSIDHVVERPVQRLFI
jgi:hypothetical protein